MNKLEKLLAAACVAAMSIPAPASGFWRVGTDLCVTDFGAKGDGVADDTEALQRAADALADKNGNGIEPRYYGKWWSKTDRHQVRLVFPRGKYRITAPVFFRCKAAVVGDGAEIVQQDPSSDSFYLCRGFNCRFSGFRFRGGKSQIRLCTHNNEGSHLYVGDCSFHGSSGSAIECLSFRSTADDVRDRTRDIGEWDWNAERRRYERDPRWDGPRAPNNNSTLFMVERCFFDDCAHAIEASCDGAVYRQCRVLSKRSSPGGAILFRNLLHAYDMDIVVRRDPKLKQSAFEGNGCFLWLEDSKVRTDDGSGAPLVVCGRRERASYLASSVVVENVETETGAAQGVVEIANGRPHNLISLLRVRETGSRKDVPMIAETPVKEESLSKASPSVSYPVDLSYSFCLRECSGIVPPTGQLARFMRPEPDPRSGRDLVPRRAGPRRAGPVLFASDDGVDADSSTDDTAALARFLARLSGTPGAVGVLPGARLTVKGPFDVKGDFELVGAGLTLLDADTAQDLFRVAPDSRVTFKSLMTCGGRTLFDVGARADVRLEEGCIIYVPTGTAIRTAAGARFLMDDGMAYAAKFYDGDGEAFISSVWYRFLSSREENARPGAAIVNRGRLQMWDMLGVPVLFSKYRMNDVFHPELPPTEYRWVDNSGVFFSRMCRYGGEWGGVTPVFHHGRAVSALEGSYAWFTTTFTYPTPILCDVPDPDVRCFSVMFSPLFKYLPDIEFKWRRAEGEALRPTEGGRIEVCYPMPLKTARPRDPSTLCLCGEAPERANDFFWENDRVGFRAYGPGDVHKWSGIDVFNKNTSSNIVHSWLRRLGPKCNWHKNVGGLGMDDYAVGPGRGVGGIALRKDGKWLADYGNWTAYRIVANSDARCAFELDYRLPIGGTMTLAIELARGESFFREAVSFSPDTPLEGVEVGVGMDLSPARLHAGSVSVDEANGVVSLFENPHLGGDGRPVPGEEGSTMSAVFACSGVERVVDGPECSKVLITRPLTAKAAGGGPVAVVMAGADWSEAGRFRTADAWHAHVRDFRRQKLGTKKGKR